MTIRTQAELATQIDTLFPDNTAGDISPADNRSIADDIIESVVFARNKNLAVFTAMDGIAPAANYATLDTIANTGDTPNSTIPVLDFDPGATEEYMVFQGVMEPHYKSGGLTATIYWFSEATTGDVIWSLAFKSLTAATDNIATKAFAAENDSAASTTAGTARVLNSTTITFTDGADMDSIAAGEPFQARLHRSSAAAGDTMDSNDAEFFMLVLKET